MLVIVNNFLSLLQYDFMQHALVAGTLAALLSAIVGFFIVIRSLSFAAHAMSHIGLAGATGASLLGINPLLGQLTLSLVTAGSMGYLDEKLAKSDLIIGISLTFALGLGGLFLHLNTHAAASATSILFGDLLGVSQSALILMASLTAVCLLAMSIIARPLWFASLEPNLAVAKGVPLRLLTISFFIIIAIAVSLASQVVGILLVFTLLIGPPAIALQWTRSFWPGIIVSILISISSVWLSILFASIFDWPISFFISSFVFLGYLYSVWFRKE